MRKLIQNLIEYVIGYPLRTKRINVDKKPKEINSITFCISTNGKKAPLTEMQIKSILNNVVNNAIKYEIVVCGNIEKFKKYSEISNLKLIDALDLADTGKLAALRNKAAENCTSEVIVFTDDDVIFEDDWLQRLQEYSQNKYWDILGNKILLPDGGRYWDRAIVRPHTMVDYDHPEDDPRLYQTGCFWVIKNDVFSIHKWDGSIVFYAKKQGYGINEDVEFSRRLIKNGYVLSFDSENTVWHHDSRYKEVSRKNGRLKCFKTDTESTFSIKDFSYLKGL